MVKWLGLHAFIAKDMDSVPDWELRFHKLLYVANKYITSSLSIYLLATISIFQFLYLFYVPFLDFCVCHMLCCAVLSRSVVSDSLQPLGL